MTDTEPGWYRDPMQPKIQRYWNGTTWTPRTAPVPPSNLRNPVATAAMALGITGALGWLLFALIMRFLPLLLLPVPLVSLVALVLGIIGVVKGRRRDGVGVRRALVGFAPVSVLVFWLFWFR
ncbi:DUF2510 domain-containing protein [Rathayibacter sp. Leaf248]|uniref:DUF2510 domain-containing protein n=1 Tax=Rathayibacter sp. Leaf248 TaxID=2876555 RepID=UPI001E426B64|nr:DUF2510 domain-containing protein [Rathayibacter sp. Leaf248]